MNFVIKLEEQEANLVLNALAELPFKMSQPLIVNIQAQCKEQFDANKEKENAVIEG